MCLIYYRNQRTHLAPIDYSSLSTAMRQNPDGSGLATYANGKWHVSKSTLVTWAHFRDALQEVSKYAEKIVVHFRYATAGKCNDDNCHPFKLAKNTYFAHNGIFQGIEEKNDRSDTRQVADCMQALIEQGASPSSAFALARLMGDRNKLCLMLPSGKVQICGDWESMPDGLYSNSSCLWSYDSTRYSQAYQDDYSRYDDYNDNYRDTYDAELWDEYINDDDAFAHWKERNGYDFPTFDKDDPTG